ncbi:hypothetical protein J4E82_004188 [Alternaria postmessia]|uniref:uncharacterized protein n=1 Tax=Alternaria postmessia TaxID=1187938 RepID=UPI0022249A9A|nr:uncharacterized protein J4E82_004188 [Alternaria postmessia]KAI5377105.1 hypothetical protein J4E82_004188 [Alternaria postmessia]
MASSKRKFDDGDSNWEVTQVVKPPKVTAETAAAELQEDRGNYGSRASQRPRRARKRPERFADQLYQPVSKKKETPKRVTKPLIKPPSKRSLATKNSTSRRSWIEPHAVTDTVVNIVDDSPGLPARLSKIVRLKIPLTGSTLAIPTNQPRQQYSDESESELSSPPASLPSSPVFSYKNIQNSPPLDRRGQCAQRTPEPVPASSQDVATPSTAPENPLTSQATVSQHREPKTPEESIRGTPAFVHHTQTQSSPGSPEIHDRFTYLTPDSAFYRDANTVYSKLDVGLENGQVHNQIEMSCRGKTEPLPSLYAASEATTECEELSGPLVGEQVYTSDTDYLRDITERLLVQQNKGPNKPEPYGQPEVWADGRQELCETLHYYRAYQSACYSTGGFARGFMFDKVAHNRDYMDSNVVLSRAGGGLMKDIDSGEMKSKRDQSEDSAALGLRNCMIHRNPVVIITGVDSPNIPSKPPHQYCVLDYFKPTHVWAEKSGDSKIVRYRFEKLNTKKESWWRAKDAQEVIELGSLPSPVEKVCGSCNLQSPQVYLNGWMCLQSACTAFWKIYTNTAEPGRSMPAQEPKEASLVYDPRFLKQKTPWHNDDHDYPLASNAAELSRHAVPAHMVANKTVLEEDGGPDAMFEELQQTDIGLQRRSMPNGQLKGPNYCRHFAVNYGMPYKFIAATASRPFDGAARPITSTRSRLNWAAKLLLAEENGKSMDEVCQEWQEKEFNEVLASGYFEEQKINYHDDGEFGLGPTIATLSLGAPGTMRIRMKARHYHGVSSVARLALQLALDVLKRSDTKAWNTRRKQIPKQLGLTHRGTARDVLTMQLGHGDIVVMHGADVQKYYEHAVEHAGKLRFALTCRYIDPESLKPEDQPKYAVGSDAEGYDGSGLM